VSKRKKYLGGKERKKEEIKESFLNIFVGF